MRERGGHAAKGHRARDSIRWSHLFPYLILIFKHSVIIKLTKVGWEIVMKNSDWLSDRAKHEIQAKDAQAFWTIQCFKNE